MENISKRDAKNLAVSYAVYVKTNLSDYREIRVWWPILIKDQERTGVELVPRADLESHLKRANEHKETPTDEAV